LIFKKHDKDGSGNIDIMEMRSVLQDEVGIVISVKEAETLATRFDMDNDGLISFDEVSEVKRKRERERERGTLSYRC
jgi:Ca2+-binding EF-hand superfamily protein